MPSPAADEPGSAAPATGPTRCPCGTGATYDDCCGRIHRGTAGAATAEQLMRSRFSAFALGDEAYLRRSWHPSTRPRRIHLDPDRRWTRLEVRATRGGGLLDDEGTVTFVAHHRTAGVDGTLVEVSRFVRSDGAWVYVGPAEGG